MVTKPLDVSQALDAWGKQLIDRKEVEKQLVDAGVKLENVPNYIQQHEHYLDSLRANAAKLGRLDAPPQTVELQAPPQGSKAAAVSDKVREFIDNLEGRLVKPTDRRAIIGALQAHAGGRDRAQELVSQLVALDQISGSDAAEALVPYLNLSLSHTAASLDVVERQVTELPFEGEKIGISFSEAASAESLASLRGGIAQSFAQRAAAAIDAARGAEPALRPALYRVAASDIAVAKRLDPELQVDWLDLTWEGGQLRGGVLGANFTAVKRALEPDREAVKQALEPGFDAGEQAASANTAGCYLQLAGARVDLEAVAFHVPAGDWGEGDFRTLFAQFGLEVGSIGFNPEKKMWSISFRSTPESSAAAVLQPPALRGRSDGAPSVEDALLLLRDNGVRLGVGDAAR